MTMATDNSITVKFFARLREELDTSTLTVEAQPGLTAGQLLHSLASKGGNWARLKSTVPFGTAVPAPGPSRRLPDSFGTVVT